MFDDLSVTAVMEVTSAADELKKYLSTGPEQVANPLQWWCERKSIYPNLSRMARSYLTVPRMRPPLFAQYVCAKLYSSATTINVERLFSKGRILITHLHNGLSASSISALMCLNNWVENGLVKDSDVLAVTAESPDDDVEGHTDVWGHNTN